MRLTRRILEGSRILQLHLVEHVIIGMPALGGAAISALKREAPLDNGFVGKLDSPLLSIMGTILVEVVVSRLQTRPRGEAPTKHFGLSNCPNVPQELRLTIAYP